MFSLKPVTGKDFINRKGLIKEMVKELRLEGVTFGGDAETVTSIVDIIEDLDKSTFFSDVWLSSSEENNEYSKSGATFEIVCKIVP